MIKIRIRKNLLNVEKTRRLTEFKKNHIWISENYKELKKEYPNKWVAVKNREVVETGLDYKSFVSELKKKYEFGPTEIAISYIETKQLPVIESFYAVVS